MRPETVERHEREAQQAKRAAAIAAHVTATLTTAEKSVLGWASAAARFASLYAVAALEDTAVSFPAAT
jgi:hypothetical protein